MSNLHIEKIGKKYIVKKKIEFQMEIDDLVVNEGEFFGLIGASGCGKSTLLKIIAGLIQSDHGKVVLDDKEITNVATTNRNIGMIFQEALLFPHMTVNENVGFGLRMLKVKKNEIEHRVFKILESVGLSGYENRYPHELSGGQQQRVAIARALVCNPKILLMDEPFSALDMKLRVEMRNLIKKLHRDNGMTIIFITHDKDEAFDLFTTMGVMETGRIVQVGTPEDVYKKPNSVYVAELLGIDNVIKGILEKNVFVNDSVNVDLMQVGDKEAGYLIVPAESIGLEKIVKSNKTINRGFIENIKFSGGFYEFQIKSHGNRFISMQNSNMKFKVSDEVAIKINNELVHFVGEE